MGNNRDLIDSGILELYVLGQTSQEENTQIERLIESDESIRKELHEIELALEKYAIENSIEPNITVKALLMATLDYANRMENGEQPSSPPLLNDHSKISDYNEWLNRADMVPTSDFDNIFVKLISHTPEATTAIVWIKEMAPQEVHDDEFEKFLIVEGSCELTVGEIINQLSVGDYFSMPLHQKHHITVTSKIPCKVILQRVAA